MSKLTVQPDPVTAPAAQSAAGTYRRLMMAGLTAREAATLVGRLHGLAQVRSGWSIGEVEHLLFVQELVRTGRLGS
jgi:hypothetical protein